MNNSATPPDGDRRAAVCGGEACQRAVPTARRHMRSCAGLLWRRARRPCGIPAPDWAVEASFCKRSDQNGASFPEEESTALGAPRGVSLLSCANTDFASVAIPHEQKGAPETFPCLWGHEPAHNSRHAHSKAALAPTGRPPRNNNKNASRAAEDTNRLASHQVFYVKSAPAVNLF